MAARVDEEEIDVLALHQKILLAFKDDREALERKRKTLHEMEKASETEGITHSTYRSIEFGRKQVEKEIADAESGSTEGFYLMEASEIVSKFEKILLQPLVLSFMGAPQPRDNSKDDLIARYAKVVKKFRPDLELPTFVSKDTDTDSCAICKNINVLESEGYLVCTACGHEREVPASSSSYKDAERVNVGSKYTYDKRIHFRDCINQFQGKQNATIPDRVYAHLEKEFHLHGLLVPSPDKEIKYSQIRKEHILLFLKEGGFSKHYEDAVLIHYNLTGIRPPDITHLETKIINDFDKLVETYDAKYNKQSDIDGITLQETRKGRKNFINNQYVLYQLLRRHNYPCDVSEFSILKTTERKSYHDDVCRELFKELGWNFTSVF